MTILRFFLPFPDTSRLYLQFFFNNLRNQLNEHKQRLYP